MLSSEQGQTSEITGGNNGTNRRSIIVKTKLEEVQFSWAWFQYYFSEKKDQTKKNFEKFKQDILDYVEFKSKELNFSSLNNLDKEIEELQRFNEIGEKYSEMMGKLDLLFARMSPEEHSTQVASVLNRLSN